MKITSVDSSVSFPAEKHARDLTAARVRANRSVQTEAPAAPAGEAAGGTRGRIILLQRSVAQAQRVIAALEGFAALMRDGLLRQSRAAAYIEGNVFQGRPVLEALREQLLEAARGGRQGEVQRLLGEERARLGLLAQELSRDQTAEQNSRALATAGDALERLKSDIRHSGDRLLDVHREAVLRLLG
jgi:hypothetical protein